MAKKRNEPETIDEAIEVLSEVARQDQRQVKDIVDDRTEKVTQILDTPSRVKERVKKSLSDYKRTAVGKSSEFADGAAEFAEETADKVRLNPWPFLLGFVGTIGVVSYSFYKRNQYYKRPYRAAH
jgi:ElaB/YqjD/DUF883 family membrane-anchored ribosome-binding protein